MSASIGHVILSVSDFARSVAFYDALLLPLGFASGWSEEGGDIAIKEYRSQGHTLFVRCDRTREHKPFVRDVGLDHLAFKVSGRELVDAAYALVSRAESAQAKPPREFPEYTETYYACYFRDPDGIPLEVACY